MALDHRGAALAEHLYQPITPGSIRRAAELGDDLPVVWRHRSLRYTEKLATPDTFGDLIGDVDPVKVAQGRSIGASRVLRMLWLVNRGAGRGGRA